MSGWYKQNRNLFERAWSNDSKAVSIYVYLHCAAYAIDRKLHGQIIRRGSCLTSRKIIMEETGLSEYDVKSRLKLLLDAGEILVKYSNKGTIITVCDYDGYSGQDDLFAPNSSSQLSSQLPSQLPNELPTSIYIQEERRENKDNLRTHFVPSKTERERSWAVANEIKVKYNKMFEGVLPEWKRQSEKMARKVGVCVARYGRQSVDMVFDQIRHETFGVTDNRTGFQVDFSYIFELEQFEKYLARYELRVKKSQKRQDPTTKEPEQPKSSGSWLDAYNENQNWKPNIKR